MVYGVPMYAFWAAGAALIELQALRNMGNFDWVVRGSYDFTDIT